MQRSEHYFVCVCVGRDEAFDFYNLGPSSVIQSFMFGYINTAKLYLLLK